MSTEKRLIDANAFHKELYERPLDFLDVGGDFGYFDETIESVLNEQPTVDAVEVVHGRWEKMDITGLYARQEVWNCSVCGHPVGIWSVGSKYCPNCGAKMDGDGNV